MKATKRPWRVFKKSGIFSIIEGKGDKQIIHWAGFDSSYFPEQNEANAALIVEAVNAYDSLLARNKRLTDALDQIAKDTILDKQECEYYKRIHLIHKDWAHAALAEDKV